MSDLIRLALVCGGLSWVFGALCLLALGAEADRQRGESANTRRWESLMSGMEMRARLHTLPGAVELPYPPASADNVTVGYTEEMAAAEAADVIRKDRERAEGKSPAPVAFEPK